MTIFSNRHWHRKCIEPIKRKHGGNGSQWVSHRFEIKGGISWREAMLQDMMTAPLLSISCDGQLSFRGVPVQISEAA